MSAPARDPSEPRAGRLKVFFGYAAGVGTTAAMLDAAVERARLGETVLHVCDAGAPSARGAANALPELRTLALPPGADLDVAAIRRAAPDLVLVPALERGNGATARHRRRVHDVRDLLTAGIDVFCTLEVQHVDSLADIVQRITGRTVAHTVPDAVLDAASELELIDLPPEELLERSRRGGAGGAAPELPERSVLVALREVAMRYAADRVRRQLPDTPSTAAAAAPTAERLLVGVGPSPSSARVLRVACRMARSLHAPWHAVHVAPAGDRAHDLGAAAQHLELARSLGAEVAVVAGGDMAAALAAFARERGVTRMLVGETRRTGWRSWLEPSLVHRVIDASRGVDVVVIRGGDDGAERPAAAAAPGNGGSWRGHVLALVALVVASAIVWAFDAAGLGEADQVLVYLLAVTAVAAWLGRGPAVVASFGAVLAFNFFFTAPRFTLRVQDPGNLFTLGVLLVIGLVVSTLTSRIRAQSIVAQTRERRTEQLYRLSHELSATTGPRQLVAAATAHLQALTGGEVAILLPGPTGELQPGGGAAARAFAGPELLASAERVIRGDDDPAHAVGGVRLVALRAHAETVGVLAIRVLAHDPVLLADGGRLIDAFAAQVALALQRDRLTEQVHRSLAQADTERLRSALLSSVSHDLRTPLAAITGATSTLLDADGIDSATRTGLLRSVHEEAERLARLLDNLFHMTRLESGALAPEREWHVVEDIVGSALTRVARALAGRAVTTDLPADLPLVCVDGVLIELVLVNLLDNAVKYSPAGSAIDVAVRAVGPQLDIAVLDRGPGLTADETRRACEKFYRGPGRRTDGTRGAGLGLAICAAIAQLHGGAMRIEQRPGGGACIVLQLPIEDQPPALDGDEPPRRAAEAT